MAIQKTYSFYGDASVTLTSTAELLQFDIANDHIACSLINMGNQANGRQKSALANAVLAYAENIDDPCETFHQHSPNAYH